MDIPQNSNNIPKDSDTIKQTQSRIIYMRDFGSIAPSARPFFPYLLQALRIRRAAKFEKGSLESEKQIQPTVLILGFAEKLKEDNQGRSFLMRRRTVFQDSSIRGFIEGGAALRQILPPLGSKISTSKDETPLPLLSPLSITFFLTSLTSPGELDTKSLPSGSNCDPADDPFECFDILPKDPIIAEYKYTPINNSFSISIFPRDSHTASFREIEKRMSQRRRHDIQNAWMIICLRQRGAGADICGSPLDSTQATVATVDQATDPLDITQTASSLDEFCLLNHIPILVAMDRIVTNALGISQLSSSASPTHVHSTVLSRAYRLYTKNWEARADWLKSVAKNSRNDKFWGDNNSIDWGPGFLESTDESTDDDRQNKKKEARKKSPSLSSQKKQGADMSMDKDADNDRKGKKKDDQHRTPDSIAQTKQDNKPMDDNTAKKEDDKYESLDPIVEKVKQSTDLSCYEERLLGCIVDDS